MSRYLYKQVRDQWNGKYDLLTTIQYEFQYEDLFKDNEDMRIVNFRYGDHVDRAVEVSQLPVNIVHKPGADKAKAAENWYRHGNNSYLDWFKQKLF
jgi:hypothetical protein